MIALSYALIHILGGPGRHRVAPLLALGIRRDEFGDDHSPGVDRFHATFATFPTIIYFPSGAWKERFYINGGPGEQRVLQYEVRHGDNVVQKWVIPLDIFNHNIDTNFVDAKNHRPLPLPSSISRSGTMIKLLYRSGCKIHGSVTKAIWAKLNSKEGYAGYSTFAPEWGKFFYWYVDIGGEFSEVYSLELGKVRKTLPVKAISFSQMGFPYPISVDEREDMTANKVGQRGPTP